MHPQIAQIQGHLTVSEFDFSDPRLSAQIRG
jgi:hypothetical protein